VRQLIAQAPSWLRPGGMLAMEIGIGQSEKLVAERWRRKIIATFGRKRLLGCDTFLVRKVWIKILVHGGRRLSGSIKVSGSKNSSLPTSPRHC